jgi:hypothetical protein
MSRSLIQTANQSPQAVAVNGIIPLGSVQRRYGCNLRMSGNGIEVSGEGYYTIDCNASVLPTAIGAVTVAVYNNGVQIPGAIAYGYAATAETPVTLGINTTIRQGCCCDSADNLTCVLLDGPGTVSNISLRVIKE